MKGRNRKLVKETLSDNANAFCRLTTLMIGKKLEIKVTPSLNRVKDFLLENHGFQFNRADPILSEKVLGKNRPGNLPPPDSKTNPIPNLTLTLLLSPHGGFFPGVFLYGKVATQKNILIIAPYSYHCFILFIFEIDPSGVGLPPL